jgi:hypothetical protein
MRKEEIWIQYTRNMSILKRGREETIWIWITKVVVVEEEGVGTNSKPGREIESTCQD